jgi:hypothetical protein
MRADIANLPLPPIPPIAMRSMLVDVDHRSLLHPAPRLRPGRHCQPSYIHIIATT